jgi:arylsulfatase A-like enzyme
MVPLVLHVPGIAEAGRRVPGLVQTMDIFPTVLELLGLDIPAGVEGESLVPLVAAGGPESTTQFAFSETFPFPEKCPPRHAVRTRNAKLIWMETDEGEVDRHFFNLQDDPAESRNLYPQGLPMAARLDSVLARWIAPKGLHPARIPTAEEIGRWRILKRLGYVE